MIFVSAAFLFVLVRAHLGGDWNVTLAKPMSLFRDGADSTLGYWLFSLLLASGAVLMQLLVRLRWWLDAGVILFAFVLLAIVASTPSTDVFHLCIAMLLLLLLYLYFAFLFYRLESRWFWVHLVAPVLIVLLTRLHSYGLWQKSLIVYYLAAMNAQYYACAGWLRASRQERSSWKLPSRDTERRQKVYTVDE